MVWGVIQLEMNEEKPSEECINNPRRNIILVSSRRVNPPRHRVIQWLSRRQRKNSNNTRRNSQFHLDYYSKSQWKGNCLTWRERITLGISVLCRNIWCNSRKNIISPWRNSLQGRIDHWNRTGRRMRVHQQDPDQRTLQSYHQQQEPLQTRNFNSLHES